MRRIRFFSRGEVGASREEERGDNGSGSSAELACVAARRAASSLRAFKGTELIVLDRATTIYFVSTLF